MDWLITLRLFNIVVICLSTGILTAAVFRSFARTPIFIRVFAFSYVLFALNAAIDIQRASNEDYPFTWRTVMATLASVLGIAACSLAYLYWPKYDIVKSDHE